MRIERLIWNQKNIEHIAAHHVSPDEVEEVCRSNPLIFTAPSKGANPAYYALGQTFAGRYVFTLVIAFGKGVGYVVTARDMTNAEKRRYQQWKNRS